ncbi:hypothetical protein OFB72_32685, partial [Escherichia coli]|nr:hypothetical protein [Escherichia coli]
LLMNVIWAIGGGAINIIFERAGGIDFAKIENLNPDAAVAISWTAAGLGLGLGMMIAHRASVYLDQRRRNTIFIGVSLI